MRVTITRTKGTVCAVCKTPMPVGEPGVAYSVSTWGLRRAHVACYKKQTAAARGRATTDAADIVTNAQPGTTRREP
jgi:hypothetical protein